MNFSIVSPFMGRLVYREAARPAAVWPPHAVIAIRMQDEPRSSDDAQKRLRLRCRDKPRVRFAKQTITRRGILRSRSVLVVCLRQTRSFRTPDKHGLSIHSFLAVLNMGFKFERCMACALCSGEAVLVCKEKNGFLSRRLLRKDCDGTVAFLPLHYSPAIRTALQGEPSAPARFRGAALRK